MLYEIDISTATQVLDDQPPAFAAGKQIHAGSVQAETTDLEIPSGVWVAMFVSYAIFFGGLMIATGRETGAIFMIVISILYAIMYFGVAGILFTQNLPVNRSLFTKGLGPLITNTGPMGKAAVLGQILTIPFCLAFFGVAIAILRFAIMG